MKHSSKFSTWFVVFLALLCAGTVAAWSSPSTAPPGGNTSSTAGAPTITKITTAGLGSFSVPSAAVPANTAYMVVEVWGGGGGGGGGGSNSSSYAGGGGQGGGYSMKVISNPSGTYYYTIGAGAAGGTVGGAGGTVGGAGGQTCFAATNPPCTSPLVHAYGGAGGPATGGLGTSAGPGTAGDLTLAGGMGGATLGYPYSGYSPYIGGSPGGSGARGGGGGAGGGTGYGSGTNGNGTAGNPFGGGGGGAGNINAIATGGTGGVGGIVITAYPN